MMGEIIKVDGKVDLAKTAAFIAHLLMAGAFLRLQVMGDNPFDLGLWGTYGGFAIAHDAYNRATAMVKDTRDKRIEAETVAAVVQPSTTTTTITEVKTP